MSLRTTMQQKDDPLGEIWARGTSVYKIRVGVIFAIYALYTVFVVFTLTMFIVKARNKHTGLSRRSVILVTIQAVGAFLIGTDGLVSTALNTWPCFIMLWLFNVGFMVMLTAMSARALQLIVLTKIHLLNSKLTSRDVHGAARASSNLPRSQQPNEYIWNKKEYNMHTYLNMSAGPDQEVPYGDNSLDRMSGPLPADDNFGNAPQASLQMIADNDIFQKNKHNDLPMVPRSIFNNENAQSAEWLRDYRSLQRYTVLKGYVTDRAMTFYVVGGVAIAIIISLVTNATNSEFSLSPMSKSCGLFWGFIPVVIIIAIYLIFICPILLFQAWSFKDAYGIRTDLIICDTAGLLAFVMTVIWDQALPQYAHVWSSMFFMWVAVILIHISSVLIPLLAAIRHSRNANYQFNDNSNANADLSAMPGGAETSAQSRQRAEFNRMLDDPFEYRVFREFAASCFSSELTGFVDEYQALKAQTIIALGHDDFSLGGNNSDTHYNTSLDGSIVSTNRLVDNPMSPNSKPLQLNTGINVSILDTARAAYPHYELSEHTPFPPAIMDKLVSMFSSYINPNSYTSVNVPPVMVRRIRNKLTRRELHLTILDEVKDEVLYMLFTEVFSRFSEES
ncbi:hypothetical protein GGI12_004202 [Dipsacomyces acuminosporus]|nr:hypothetical protein GGI12_004202 [Dipsacomyces acuminosporus]